MATNSAVGQSSGKESYSNDRPIHIKEVKTSWIERIHTLNIPGELAEVDSNDQKNETKTLNFEEESQKQRFSGNKVEPIATINDKNDEGKIRRPL